VVPLLASGGHIVQISSVNTRNLPNPKFAPYVATKVALEQFTEAMRLELHPRGIKVSQVTPGLVDTPIYDTVKGFQGTQQKIREQVPVWLAPEDVAEAIVWLMTRPQRVVISDLTIMPQGQTR
jgi:NADP-dependent 3-hydroxy acid dehydrogenase YdfG